MMKHFYVVFLLAFAVVSCRDMKEPVFNSIGNVKFDQLTLSKPSITLEMNYFNPNNFSAKLKNAEGDAWMDSAYLGHFIVDTTVIVPPNSDFIVPVNLAVDMKHILQNSLSLFLKEEVTIRISGKAKAGRGGFYKNFSLHYEGKQNLASILN